MKSEKGTKGLWWVVGDSHVYSFDTIPGFYVIHLGPRTAHQLPKNDPTVKKFINPLKGKNLIFLFGEIDCRIHIYKKHLKTGTAFSWLIAETVDRYVSYIRDLSEKEWPGIRVLNVYPTGNEGERRTDKPADYRTRKQITIDFNFRLMEECRKLRIPFINVYNELVDVRGDRKKDFVRDSIHLNKKAGYAVKERIENDSKNT